MSLTASLRRNSYYIAEYGLLFGLIVIIIVFANANPRFLTAANIGTLLEQESPVLIVAVGMTFAIISRNIDLAPASIIALAGVVMANVNQWTGSFLLAVVACFAVAILIEVFNGLLIVLGGINPLIVTLACWIWARGLAISFTGGNSIAVRNKVLSFLTAPLISDFSPAILLAILAFIIGAFILNNTRLGRYTFAMGSDERATRQAGVPVGRYKLMLFALFGVMTGLATLIVVSRLGAAAPAAAYGLELDAIVAVIIGGNPFQGGEGKMRRTLVGALFIAVLNNGLGNLGMLDAQIAVYKGTAIILALLFSAISQRLARSNYV